MADALWPMSGLARQWPADEDAVTAVQLRAAMQDIAETEVRARGMVSASRSIRATSGVLRAQARATVATVRERGYGGVRQFRIFGRVDGRPVRASWVAGHLAADYALVQRAEIVVALGESWVLEDGRTLFASLDRDGTAALMTLVRACDTVEECLIGLPSRPSR